MGELPEEQAYTVARGCGKNWMIGVARVTIVEFPAVKKLHQV